MSGSFVTPAKAKRAQVRQDHSSFLHRAHPLARVLSTVLTRTDQGRDGSPLLEPHITQADQFPWEELEIASLDASPHRATPTHVIQACFIQGHHLAGTQGQHGMLVVRGLQRRLHLLGSCLAHPLKDPDQRLPSFVFQPLGDGVISDVRAGLMPPPFCREHPPDCPLGLSSVSRRK